MKKWEEYLRENYGKKSRKKMAEETGLSIRTISDYGCKLKLSKNKNVNEEKWKRLQKEPSKNNYAEWSRELDIPIQNVHSYMKRNNLIPKTKDYTQLKEILKHNLTVPIRRISFLTGYSAHDIVKARNQVILEKYKQLKERYKKVFK